MNHTMKTRIPPIPFASSRRAFLATMGSVSVVVAFGSGPSTAATPEVDPTAWVTIAGDGTITIMSPAAEMGQGIMTALPALLAEDLDADWANVRIVQSPTDASIYGNAALGGTMRTVGSRTVPGYFYQLRLVGAQMRAILLQNAAKRLRVSVSELTTAPSVVIHAKSGQRLSYGDLARRMEIPNPRPEVTKADLKPLAHCRFIGKDIARIDVPSKVAGTAIYGIDTQLPGLLHGAVLHAPVEGERPIAVDDTDARGIHGVVKVVALPHGVGVIASNPWAAMKAKAALRVEWSKEAQARAYSSADILNEYLVLAHAKDQPVIKMVGQGDAAAGLASAAKVLSVDFFADHVAHACMEPLNATVLVRGTNAEVWVSNQAPNIMQNMCAQALGVPPANVVVHSPLLGGGFGRRTEGPEVIDAALLAKAVPGQPVKVLWSREDDLRHDTFRPLAVQRLEVGLDQESNIVGWRHRLVAESVFARIEPAAFKAYGNRDPVTAGGGTFPYAIPGFAVEYARVQKGLSVGPWRGVAPGYMKFVVETMIDEVAGLKRMDPVAFRLSLLDNQPRAANVIRAAAAMADWPRKPSAGRALGFAYSDAVESHTAAVVEVSLNASTGEIAVHKVWAAIDAGIAVQPRNIVAQMEGGIVFGLGSSLSEQITIARGEARESNFDTYRPLRMADAPEIMVEVISTDNAPSGVGEAGVAPIAPAIANAVAQLTGGKRLRHLPFLPERVRETLTA